MIPWRARVSAWLANPTGLISTKRYPSGDGEFGVIGESLPPFRRRQRELALLGKWSGPRLLAELRRDLPVLRCLFHGTSQEHSCSLHDGTGQIENRLRARPRAPVKMSHIETLAPAKSLPGYIAIALTA